MATAGKGRYRRSFLEWCLLAVGLLALVFGGWLVVVLHHGNQREAAIRHAEAKGAEIWFDSQYDVANGLVDVDAHMSFGEPFSQPIAFLDLLRQEVTAEDLRQVWKIEELQVLRFNGQGLTQQDVAATLDALPELKKFDLAGVPFTEEEQRALQQRYPKVRIQFLR